MKIFLILAALVISIPAHAKLKVVTSITDLRAIAERVGGDLISVESIAKGTQDPHFIDAKPSYMARASDADLLISIGLGLEDAWLNNVIRGARNPNLNHGQKGSLAIGPLVDPEEIPTGAELTRKEGDVHPEGNPHVTLDPVRVQKIAKLIADKLSELDPVNKVIYLKNAQAYQAELDKKILDWKARIKATGITKVVTYHKTLNYFLRRMNLQLVTELEPKPGIAPSAPYLSQVLNIMKEKNTNVVLIENYFDPTIAKKLKELNPSVKVSVVPVSVDGGENLKSCEAVEEAIVKAVEAMK